MILKVIRWNRKTKTRIQCFNLYHFVFKFIIFIYFVWNRKEKKPIINIMASKGDFRHHLFELNKMPQVLFKLALGIVSLCLLVDIAHCEYENTWNFYYEQPCCGNLNGHHIRHHRGKYDKCSIYIVILLANE